MMRPWAPRVLALSRRRRLSSQFYHSAGSITPRCVTRSIVSRLHSGSISNFERVRPTASACTLMPASRCVTSPAATSLAAALRLLVRAARAGASLLALQPNHSRLYEPFVAEWHAAFAAHGKERAAGRHSSLLVLRVEDMLDRPSTSRAALQEFLFGVHGGGGDDKTADARAATAGPSSTRSYADSHAASMNVSCCGGGRGAPEQMLQSTRDVLSGFYRPHNARLAALLGDDRFLLWDT